MVDNVTGVTLTFNGEIYNYVELRDELEDLGHRFLSNSDTEVLLRAYLEWGSQCVQRFNGDWAFLIFDPRTRTAFFARDRFAVKPLYYTRARGGVSIASEPKGLLTLYPELRRVNEKVLYRFLRESALYDMNQSFYEGIHVLPPAHLAIYRPDEDVLEISRYWDWPSVRSAAHRDIQAQFDALFEDAVRLRMRSDVPVGTTLSGGLDSTATTTVAGDGLNSDAGRMVAFTSVYEKPSGGASADEKEWAERAVSVCPNVELKEVTASVSNWSSTLRRIVKYMDGPGYSPAVYPLWNIMQSASHRGIKVLVEGQGADELLGGYPDHSAAALLDEWWFALSRCKLGRLIREFRGYWTTFGGLFFVMRLARLVSPWLRDFNYRYSGAVGAMRSDFIKRAGSTSAGGIQAVRALSGIGLAEREMRIDFESRILPGLLHYGDAISMANGIESRLPFLDYRLVEFCASLPIDWKIRGGQTKYILREFLRRNKQSQIANRKDKKGYPTPIDQLLKEDNGKVLRELLMAPDSKILEYCDHKGLNDLINRYLSGWKRSENPLYRLVSAELWLRECIDPGYDLT
jgi:asparagine synthase (glutamine-hydrolysing)